MSTEAALWGVAAIVVGLVVLAAFEAWLGQRTYRPLSQRMGFNDFPLSCPLGTEALDLAAFHDESRRPPLLGGLKSGSHLASQTAPYRPQSPKPFKRDAS